MELITDIWNTISPFVVGYLVFFMIFMVLVVAFIVYVIKQVIKGHKEFNQMRDNRLNRKR